MPQTITIDALCEKLRAQPGTERYLTAIAGAPGSGKSTLADKLVEALNAATPGSAAVLPMDGYHYDDTVLNARGWRARKGAPHTFDVAGFAHMLSRMRANCDPEIAVPVFDRSIEIARAGARLIPQSVRHVIAEGNYLLLNQAPWGELAAQFDLTVFLEVPFAELERRLAERWDTLQGVELITKMEGNDLPNARTVIRESRRADLVVEHFDAQDRSQSPSG
ncbi:nucleoside/nucleotide kinase family protein [Primorskyibacter marinus]|uniref:nucleoside/nucleotide kinase family protein n=1 Tax=Primorskyibacter marinus TaxID=1977320 RepID=UPI000E307F47|nr:nucleoside/nucleotide kinase family protein [Primorskyibacter marinus]